MLYWYGRLYQPSSWPIFTGKLKNSYGKKYNYNHCSLKTIYSNLKWGMNSFQIKIYFSIQRISYQYIYTNNKQIILYLYVQVLPINCNESFI